jgi:hypothetical protein
LLMVLARNALALHAGALWSDRIIIFLTCQTLQQRHGDAWCGHRLRTRRS